MRHFTTVLLIIASSLPFFARAQQPPAAPDARAELPAGQRHLTPVEQQHVAELQAQIDEAVKAGDYERAIGKADEIAALRRERQGAEHWETFDAAERVRDLKWESALTDDQRQQLREFERLYTKAQEQYVRREYEAAIETARQVVELCTKLVPAGHRQIASSLDNLAFFYQLQGRYSEAELLFQRALELLQQALPADHPNIALNLGNLAMIYQLQGRYSEAEPLHQRAIAIEEYALPAGHPYMAQSLGRLASLYWAQGRYAEAEPLYQRALEIREQSLPAGHPHIAPALNNLAELYRAQSRYAEAEPLYRRALEIREQSLRAGHPEIATSLNNLATLYHIQGRHAEAEPLFQRALGIYEQALPARHPLIATSLNNLAAIYHAQGHHAEAERLYRRALEMREQAGPADHPDIAISLSNLAALYYSQGRYAEAEPLLQRALEMREQALPAGHPHIAASLNNLARVYHTQRRHTEAELLNRQACEIYSLAAERMTSQALARSVALEQYLSTFHDHALVLLELRRSSEAWAAWEATLARGFLDEYVARRSGRLDAPALQKLRRLGGQLRTLEQQVAANPELRQAYLKASADLTTYQRELAEQGLFPRQSPATLSEIQAVLPADAALVGWFDEGQNHWAVVVRSSGDPQFVRLADPQQPWSAAEAMLASRVAALVQQHPPSADLNELKTLIDALREQRWKPIRPYLAAYQQLPAAKQIIVLGQDDLLGVPIELLVDEELVVSYCSSATLYQRLISERHKRSPAAGGRLLALGDPIYESPPTEAQIAARPAAGVLVSELSGGGSAALAGIKPQDLIVAVDEQVIQSSAELRASLASRPHTTDRPRIKIWRGNLDDPQGLEFEITLREGRLGLTKVDDWTPSTEVPLYALAARSRSGAAEDSYEALSPLPGTRKEVRAIARLFNGSADVYLGWQASTEALAQLQQANQLREYQYLHLAAHGNTDPGGTWLTLARNNSLGHLRADEVLMNWELNAEQVVLSACQSGRGQRVAGEGFMGFAQSLLIAGAQSVVLSLWKVDDQATTLLMQRYYENLLGTRSELSSPLPKAQALREAKQWLRSLSSQDVMARLEITTLGYTAGPEDRPFDHPSYWSAFILIGDSE